MNCKEFEKRIPDFIENKLEYKELKSFVQHVEECEDCREELTIQFLVAEGMVRLEEGGAFDLQKELDRRMEMTRRGIRRHNGAKCAVITLVLASVLAVGALFYFL